MNSQIDAPDADQESEALAEAALASLYGGESVDAGAAETLFTRLVEGRLEPAQIAAMLIALRLKGESDDELIGAARALRAADVDFPRPDYLFADCCGTGGDGSGTINVSTATAFVAAACGLPVAKHGNRSISSRCGSADVLEQLGARLDVEAGVSRQALDAAGICFLFAPRYHPGLRHAGPVRRQLKVRTIMNLLGPCVNPAEPQVQLLGVANPAMIGPIARTLAALGIEKALVVHGAGLDEVALHGETQAMRVEKGVLTPLVLTPEDAGIERRPVTAIKGGDAEENAAILAALLKGNGRPAETDAVALNAGALLLTAGLAADLKDAVARARGAIRAGEPFRRLEMFVEATRG